METPATRRSSSAVRTTVSSRDPAIALMQALLLVVLCLLTFRAQLQAIFRTVVKDPEWAFCFATPVLILLLFLRRRRNMAQELTRGSVWGIVLLVVALVLYSLCFNYTYPRRLSLVPAIAGAILAVTGWRVLLRCIPLLLLLLLSIPTGMRFFARLIIEPETLTMEAARWTLDLLPGAQVVLHGVDLSYLAGDQARSIALGEHNRGASFFFAYAIIGIYVTFVHIRPWWQVATMLSFTVPIVLASNFLRVVMGGIVTMAGGFEPTNPTPRLLATAGSLLAAYGLFALLVWLLKGLVLEERR
jgi:exosortase/archaeosortase family protein